MFNNVPKRFIPEAKFLPQYIFAHPEIAYVHHMKTLNACDMILDRQATQPEQGERTAVIDADSGKRITYAELHRLVCRLAGGLRKLGVNPGDRVLWSLDERVEAIVSQLAIWKIGAISVPSSVTERGREIGYMMEDTEAVLVITQSEQMDVVIKATEGLDFVKHLVLVGQIETYPAIESSFTLVNWEDLLDQSEDIPDSYPNLPLDASSIFYTGGTTGKPKGCLQTHGGEVAIADLNCRLVRKLNRDDVMFTHTPVGHAFGNCEKINHPLRTGCAVVLKNRPRPQEIWDLFREYGVTVMAGAPTMYQMMLNQSPPGETTGTTKLKMCFCSGEFLSSALFEQWKTVTGIQLNNAIGTSPMREAFIDSMYEGRKMAPGTSVGRPIPGYEVKLVDDTRRQVSGGQMGRLAVRGPTGICYWKNIHPKIEEKLHEDTMDGWSLIDDAYVYDEEGWLWFKTRLDNMIVSAGRQIAATEVEEVLSEHPAVHRAAVVGVPDPERGYIVKAFIQLKPGHEGTAELMEAIRQFAKSNMALYKCPRVITFVPEISLDKVGKIERRRLRNGAEDGIVAEGGVV